MAQWRIKVLFDENDIEIPYPKRDLYIRQAPATLPAPAAANETD